MPPPLTNSATLTAWKGKNIYRLLVTPEEEHGENAHSRAQPTAAFDLYERLCGKHAFEECPAHVEREAFEEPMIVRWGTRFDPAQNLVTDVQGTGCYDVGSSEVARLRTAIWGGLHSLFPRFRASARQGCFYALTIGAKQLDDLGADGRAISDLLAGRVVFLGVDLRGEKDYTEVPVLGEVPGVHVHAMAFDNLLTYGTGYFHEPREITVAGITGNVAELVGLIAWLLIVAIGVWQGLRAESAKHPPRAASWRAGAWVTVAICGTACGAAVLGGWRQDNPGLIVLQFSVLAAYVAAAWALFQRSKNAGRALKWLARLLLIFGFIAVVFALNEVFLHWPTADWIGFVFLYLALVEAQEIFGLTEPAEADATLSQAHSTAHH